MKEILYKSTRSTEGTLKASEAILKGLADDGGLFVPLEIPALDVTVEELSKMTYQQVAYEVMKLYFTDFTEEELKNCINNAYDSKFDTEEIAPLAEVEGTYFLEELSTVSGYNLLKAPVKIKITAKTGNNTYVIGMEKEENNNQYIGTISQDGNTDGIFKVTINNIKGFELPSTGGSGIWFFVLAGAFCRGSRMCLLFYDHPQKPCKINED